MYQLEIKNKAKKELRTLPQKDQARIIAAFDILLKDPFAGKKLEGEYDGARSLRVWPYRIIYVIYQDIVTVVVLRVAHRQSVYNK